MSQDLAYASGLTPEEWSRRERVVRQFDHDWRRGLRPAIDDYLPAETGGRLAVLVELVHTDIEYRLKCGEPARVEEYLALYPELGSDREAELRLIEAELDLRRRREPGLTRDEFLARFPRHCAELLSTRKWRARAGPPRLTCPQCGAPINVPGDADQAKIDCPGCAATFRIAPSNLGLRPLELPSRLGKYELIEEVGRGQFGIVYRARDTELRRTVAVKVARRGWPASPAEVDFFFREARNVSELAHPHIVPVHDADREGETCYIVCAFVPGTNLADRLAAGRIAPREAAELAALVADALDHAHGHGVVHRDVKPSNILIDPEGQPHLTDFGLAKREAGEITLTVDGELCGTLAYMSPEQARGEAHRVDGRSDVFSLGVVLYEMLTGVRPFQGSDWMIQKQVIDGEPRPPRRINDRLPRDLETICLKCLGKEPHHRYSSAGALADDLRRFLAGRPIQARPAGRAERFVRWCRRESVLAASLTAFALAVAVGLASVTWQWHRARRALAETTWAKKATDVALGRSEESRKRAEAVLNFFKDDVLAAARPEGRHGGVGTDVTIRKAVDAAEPKIAGAFKDQPIVEADIRDTLGTTYLYLGEYPLAIGQYERASELRRSALGADHPDMLTSCSNLANAYRAAGRAAEAIALHEATLKLRETKLGLDHRDTLTSRNNLATAYLAAGRTADAVALHEATLKAWETKLGPDHLDTLISRGNLANAYRVAGRAAEAVALHEATLKVWETKLGPDHPDTLTGRSNLALAYSAAGRYADAARMHEETLKRRTSKLGPDHPDTLTGRSNLAVAYEKAGRYADAVRMHEETLTLLTAKLGPDHPHTLGSRNNLAEAYSAAGRTAEAIALHEATLRLRETKLDPDHPDTLSSRSNLAVAYKKAGRYADAVRMHEATLKVVTAKLGADHPDTLSSRSSLAVAYLAAGRTADAVALHEGTLKLYTAKLGADHPDTLISRNNLAEAYRAAGRTAEAIALHEVTLKLLETKFGLDHPHTLGSRNNLALAYQSAGRYADAARMHEETLTLLTAKLGPDHPHTLGSRNNLAMTYQSAGRYADAARMHEETLRLFTSKLGPDHPDTLSSRNNLAAAYRAGGRTAEAIALHEVTLKLRESKLGPDHPDALVSRHNLAAAYYADGRATDAVALWEEMVPATRRAFGPGHPSTLIITNTLASVDESLDRWADAEALRREIVAQRRKTTPPESPLLAGELAGLGNDLLEQAKWSEAEPVFRECLAIREKALPNDWSRFNTMSLLGGALLGQGKFSEAEPLVVPGYEGMKAHAAKIPATGKPRLPEAAERVVRLYEGWRKTDQAAAWKSKLGLADLPADVFARP